jgi:PAS domain S-box-containing protein
MHPDDRAGYLAAVDRSIETLERFRYEWRIVLPDGRIKWLQAYSQPERRGNGDICWHGVVLEVTDRKQAEAALQQSEATKNQILKAIPDLIIWMTADGTFIDLIDSDSSTTNLYPCSQAIGRDLYHLLPFEMAQARMSAIQRALATGDVQIYEQHFMLPTGIRYEEVRVVSVEGDRILVIVRDITQRHRIETERRQALADLDAQRAFLRQVIDVIPSPVFVKDLEGRFTVVNQALAAIHNLTVDDLLGKRETEFNPYFSQERFEQYQANNQEVMLTRQPQQNPPHVVVTTTGERRWLQSLLSPLMDTYGQVQGIVGNAVDVTDLKQAEEALQQQNQALQESQERFRSAFEDAPIGMALIGLDDRWLKVNPMLSDMLGYSESTLLSMNASAVVHSEDQAKLQHCVTQVLSNESRSAQVELRYCCNGGRIAWGLMSLSLVQDVHNESPYYVAQIQDITEQQAIDRMKNDFIAIVSHELRTPLTAIRGFLGLLNTGIYDNRPEKAKRMVEQALTNSDRLVRLVNDILDLERLSSGRVELVMEVCDATDLMQRAIEGVQSIADAAAIRLVVTSGRFQVWAAPDAIIQTLTNLLSNAIKFAPPNTAVILSVVQQSNAVLFQVKDRGRGIPSDKLESIFGRFQQVDVSDARQKGGTGLGLAICQSIVKQHGGNIWAESILGEGSIFCFTLPISSGIEP